MISKIDSFASFRDSLSARQMIDSIHADSRTPLNIMEFCGGHTVAVFRSGIRSVLPSRIRMLSGPGCPVCVTSNADLDKALALAYRPDVILATYGDMLKVPGSRESLRQARANGCAVELVYSPLDALTLAQMHPDRQIVFFAIGFETTAPPTAACVITARERGLKNFSVCSVMKLTIPGAQALLSMGEVKVDGIIGPGHVSSIIGMSPWSFLPDRFGIPVAISGFEPLDLLASISSIVRMHEKGEARLENLYSRVVKTEGNTKAWSIVRQVFGFSPATWRGFGEIPGSGLTFRPEFEEFDAEHRFELKYESTIENPFCRCGEVLRGIIEPPECEMFGSSCTPESPMGPCMVSGEGSCAAWYQYNGG
jgi:hydrogenase expression/formation protein HypD